MWGKKENKSMGRMCRANTLQKKADSAMLNIMWTHIIININVDPKENVAGHSGWCQPKENLGFNTFIQHMG